MYVDNKNKDILTLGEGPTQKLNYATSRAEAKYPAIMKQPNKRKWNFFLFVNAVKIYQLNAK